MPSRTPPAVSRLAPRRPDRFALLLAAIVALGVGLALARSAAHGVFLWGDSIHYVSMARSLLDGDGLLPWWGEPAAYWAPLFPAALAIGTFEGRAAWEALTGPAPEWTVRHWERESPTVRWLRAHPPEGRVYGNARPLVYLFLFDDPARNLDLPPTLQALSEQLAEGDYVVLFLETSSASSRPTAPPTSARCRESAPPPNSTTAPSTSSARSDGGRPSPAARASRRSARRAVRYTAAVVLPTNEASPKRWPSIPCPRSSASSRTTWGSTSARRTRW